jgi:hypothetical protein
MGTAKGLRPCLDPVTDDPAAAMGATRRHPFDCTFETVECHASSALSDDYRLVIIVSAHVTLRHVNPFRLDTRLNSRLSALRFGRKHSSDAVEHRHTDAHRNDALL